MRTYETIVAALVVLPKGEPLYSELATTVRLEDEAAGLFVVVEQQGGQLDRKGIAIDPDEWPTLRAAIEHQFAVCRQWNNGTMEQAAVTHVQPWPEEER